MIVGYESHPINLQKLLMEVTSAFNSPMVQARIGRMIKKVSSMQQR